MSVNLRTPFAIPLPHLTQLRGEGAPTSDAGSSRDPGGIPGICKSRRYAPGAACGGWSDEGVVRKRLAGLETARCHFAVFKSLQMQVLVLHHNTHPSRLTKIPDKVQRSRYTGGHAMQQWSNTPPPIETITSEVRNTAEEEGRILYLQSHPPGEAAKTVETHRRTATSLLANL
jgi:hypothetical protein